MHWLFCLKLCMDLYKTEQVISSFFFISGIVQIFLAFPVAIPCVDWQWKRQNFNESLVILHILEFRYIYLYSSWKSCHQNTHRWAPPCNLIDHLSITKTFFPFGWFTTNYLFYNFTNKLASSATEKTWIDLIFIQLATAQMAVITVNYLLHLHDGCSELLSGIFRTLLLTQTLLMRVCKWRLMIYLSECNHTSLPIICISIFKKKPWKVLTLALNREFGNWKYLYEYIWRIKYSNYFMLNNTQTKNVAIVKSICHGICWRT